MNSELLSIEKTCSKILLEITKLRNFSGVCPDLKYIEDRECECQETVINLLRNMVGELKPAKEAEY